MKICNNKKYQTRSGHRVIIDRKRSSIESYPVTGRVVWGDGRPDLLVCWTIDGAQFAHGLSNYLDLVEVCEDAPL